MSMPVTAVTFFNYAFNVEFVGACSYCNAAPPTHYQSLQEEGGYEVGQIPVCAHCAFKFSVGWATGVNYFGLLMPLAEAQAEVKRYELLNPLPFGNEDPWA